MERTGPDGLATEASPGGHSAWRQKVPEVLEKHPYVLIVILPVNKKRNMEADVTILLKASAEGQLQLNELSKEKAQVQQQLQTMEKALARSEKELAVFHELQEDASRSFPVAVNRVQMAANKLMMVRREG